MLWDRQGDEVLGVQGLGFRVGVSGFRVEEFGA